MNSKDSSRRNFIKQNTLTGMGVILLGSFAVEASGNASLERKKKEPKNPSIKSIGDFTLEQLRDHFRDELFSRFIPNMDKLVIDAEYGGFMCNVDITTRQLLSTDKTAWFEGRGMWTYSFLYNNFGKDPHFLDVARMSKDFVMKHQPQDDSFWINSYTREGVPKAGPGDIYSSLFIAEGLVEFSKASGDPQYRELARKTILSALARYDRSDYRYKISYGPTAAPEILSPRVLGHWMVFLRSATQFLEQGADPEIERVAQRCVEAIMKHHLNSDYKLLNEGLNYDMILPDNEWAQFAYLGHGIETLWMVMAEAVRLKDVELLNRAGEMFKRSVTVASDAVYGGHFRSLEHVGNFNFRTDKVLWVEEEILIGTMILMEHLQDEWAKEWFTQTFAYIRDKYLHPECAFIVVSGDRKMVDYGKRRAEHYHHPRCLMLNLLALDRMIQRQGKASGLFDK